MKRGALLPAVLTLVLAGFAPAEAAVIKKWSINAGVLGGFLKSDKDAGRKDTGVFGARLGLSIRPSLQVEAVFDSFATDPQDEQDLQGEITNDYTGLRVVGTFFAEEDKRTLPYVAAGGGRVKSELEPDDGSESESDDSSYWELDFGARVFVWKELNISGELGFRHARMLGITQTNAHLTVTASFFFGGVE